MLVRRVFTFEIGRNFLRRWFMKKVNQCLILAAGNGTRLRPVSAGLPKPLVEFRGKPILEHVILRAHEAGIENFVIVVGYRSDLIRQSFNNRWLGQVSITWVENPDYHKANGVSVLKAKDEIHENFLLLMSDHIFEPETAKLLMQQPLGPREVILAVDPNIDRIFDLDDATKVRRRAIISWTSERRSRTTMRSIPGCSCAARSCLTDSNQPAGTETARSPMACVGWPSNEDFALWRLARPTGKTLTRRKP